MNSAGSAASGLEFRGRNTGLELGPDLGCLFAKDRVARAQPH